MVDGGGAGADVRRVRRVLRGGGAGVFPRARQPHGVSGTGLDATCARLARSYDLTRREEDVLRLLMEGRTFAEAADELVVSLNTVKSHVRRIYAKMGVNGKADLLEKVSSAI